VIFHDITLRLGERLSTRKHDSAELLPAAVEVFRDLLERHGDDFRAPVPLVEGVELYWTEDHGAALATFWHGPSLPVTISALVTGHDKDADRKVLLKLQGLLVCLFSAPGRELGFDLMGGAQERPLIASVGLPSGLASPRLLEIVDMETCLASTAMTNHPEDMRNRIEFLPL